MVESEGERKIEPFCGYWWDRFQRFCGILREELPSLMKKNTRVQKGVERGIWRFGEGISGKKYGWQENKRIGIKPLLQQRKEGTVRPNVKNKAFWYGLKFLLFQNLLLSFAFYPCIFSNMPHFVCIFCMMKIWSN